MVKAEDLVDPSTAADRYRSLSNIVWSCLATVVLCSWVSLHPNVPRPVDEGKLTKWQWCIHKLHAFLKDGVLPFVLLLVAPEWVLMWALRQRLVVEYLIRKRRGLTRRHAFFIVMGGFHKFTRVETSISTPSLLGPTPYNLAPFDGVIRLDEEKGPTIKNEEEAYGEPDHPLDRFDVCRLLDDGRLELPPKSEIDDKSKTNWVVKSLVLLQTLWFVLQCIARKMEGFALTELEVVTLGYTFLNLVLYAIWWDKPQNVKRPIRVFCGELSDRTDEQWMSKQGMETVGWSDELIDSVLGTQDQHVDLRSMKQTPTFYSGNPPRKWSLATLPIEYFAMMMAALIGGMVGGIHFLGWSSPFPTHKMLILWRCGSVLMTSAALPTVLLFIALPFWAFVERVNAFVKAILDWTIIPIGVLVFSLLCFLAPFAYITGRVITLVLAFRTLASLPPNAFRSIRWTNFFPHI
ncbi:hypothetical protein FRC19_008528 [Serendipita sp. 401]|nr:hypothetical protein FRC19_008528 [Serendipita sp. 401]